MLRFSEGSIVIAGVCSKKNLRSIGQNYFSVNAITTNNFIVKKKSFEGQKLPNPLTVAAVKNKVSVVVVDSGIDVNCKNLNNLVVDRLEPIQSSIGPDDTSHGTLVASRVVYGDEILSSLKTHELHPVCTVIDVNVFGKDSNNKPINLDEYELAQVLDEVVPKLKRKAKIFNLSLGYEHPAPVGKFSFLGHRLDYLSNKHKVLFIVTAGNFEPFNNDKFPGFFARNYARIQPPAESILSLTVGSVAKNCDSTSLSRAGEISPFSCVGPGSDNGIKPEVVAHGGNMVLSPTTAAYGLGSDGNSFSYDVGTSFSAPIISNYAAQILGELPDASPNLIKALLIHFSEPRLYPSVGSMNDHQFVGFGEPQINRCISSVDSAVTYIHESEIDTDNYQFVKFHVPACFVDGSDKILLRLTIVSDPPINLDNHSEYAKTRLIVHLSKNTSKSLQSIAFGANDFKSQYPWSPVIKMEKMISKGYAAGEWQIKLRCYNRGRLDRTHKQTYALVVEIIDPNGGLPVYDDVIQTWGSIYGNTSASQAMA